MAPPPSEPLFEAFLDALPAALRERGAATPDLGERLSGVVAEARAAWPAIHVPDGELAAHAAGCLPADGEDLSAALAALRPPDLLLALGCARGDAAALRAFDAAHAADVTDAARAAGCAGDLADEVAARLRRKLFVPEDGRRSRMLDYRGRGELGAWVRAIAYREAVDLLRSRRREVPLDEVGGFADAAGPDPELDYLKEHYRSEFRVAFEAALSALAPRDRTLLRYHVIDGLTIDRIGAMYGVHRATAARWLEAARETLLSGTRGAMALRLGVDARELESVMALIRSRLDVTLSGFLREREP